MKFCHLQQHGWLKGIVLGEISQTEKDKYCMISIMCVTTLYNKLVKVKKEKADSQIQRTN